MEQSKSHAAKKTQRIDNGIEAQRAVLKVPPAVWTRIWEILASEGAVTPKESAILKLATRIPSKVPSDKQRQVLLAILERARLEGIEPKLNQEP